MSIISSGFIYIRIDGKHHFLAFDDFAPRHTDVFQDFCRSKRTSFNQIFPRAVTDTLE